MEDGTSKTDSGIAHEGYDAVPGYFLFKLSGITVVDSIIMKGGVYDTNFSPQGFICQVS